MIRSDNSKIKIVILEDEEFDIKRIENTLKTMSRDYLIDGIFGDGEDFLEYLKKNRFKEDVIIMDYQLSGNLYGEELIKKIKEIDPFIQIIVITKMTININDIYFANELMKSGACWYGTKYPIDIDKYIYQPTDFNLAVINAYERKKLELSRHRSDVKIEKNIENILTQNEIVGVSKEIEDVKALIDRYSKTDANVLITGESGVGKELVALHIHYKSNRRFENYITVNCAAIPNELIESELFGYTKGAFTGAKESKAGLFEQADGGTIFLDEISEMPIQAQAKLLRIIETGELQKIGSEKKCKVNVRIISATNRDITKIIQEKKIREDLFYRLNVLNINIKPLRERRDDVEVLIDYFCDKFSSEYNLEKPIFEKEAIKFLIQYDWPGNIRQLKNFIQRVVINGIARITKDVAMSFLNVRIDLEKNLINFSLMNDKMPTLKEFDKRAKYEFINYVRKISSSDAEAARKLGIAPPNFHRLCKELGLK